MSLLRRSAKCVVKPLSDLRSDITWHMVGHIQTNKAKLAANIFDFIHSVDSIKLAQALDRHTSKILPVLLEINVSGEETKQGLALHQVNKAMEEIRNLPNLDIRGLMTIAPWTDNPEDVRPVFKKLRQLRDASSYDARWTDALERLSGKSTLILGGAC